MPNLKDIAAEEGEIMLFLGPGSTVGAGPREALIVQDPETKLPYLVAHLPCGCQESECLGIVHWFRFAEDGGTPHLAGTGIHSDITLPAQSMGGGMALEVTDASQLDVIDARESDDSFFPTIPAAELEVLARLSALPNVQHWQEQHPTEVTE